MVDFELDVDESFANVIQYFGNIHSGKQIEKAIKRAVRKTLRWLSTEIYKDLAAEAGVKKKTLKDSRRIAVKINGLTGLLWVGLNPLPAHDGRVSWSRSSAGAKVNGKTLDGTFVARIYSEQPKVWIRSSRNRDFGHPLVHSRRKPKAASGIDRGRLPVELVGIEIDDYQKKADARLKSRAQTKFETLLEQELNYALEVEKK